MNNFHFYYSGYFCFHCKKIVDKEKATLPDGTQNCYMMKTKIDENEYKTIQCIDCENE